MKQYIQLYQGLHRVFSSPGSPQQSPTSVRTEVTQEDSDSDSDEEPDPYDQKLMGLGLEMISNLVSQIIRNLKIEISNTSLIVVHPSPFDHNYNTVCRLSLGELTIHNKESNRSGVSVSSNHLLWCRCFTLHWSRN